jgi:hypothetical protein
MEISSCKVFCTRAACRSPKEEGTSYSSRRGTGSTGNKRIQYKVAGLGSTRGELERQVGGIRAVCRRLEERGASSLASGVAAWTVFHFEEPFAAVLDLAGPAIGWVQGALILYGLTGPSGTMPYRGSSSTGKFLVEIAVIGSQSTVQLHRLRRVAVVRRGGGGHLQRPERAN